jgi:hypothetical protein
VCKKCAAMEEVEELRRAADGFWYGKTGKEEAVKAYVAARDAVFKEDEVV